MLVAHPTPRAMIRCLVGYIADDRRVRSAVYAEFGVAPSLMAIARMRSTEERKARAYIGDALRSFDWQGEKYEKTMAAASQRLVLAIERERRPQLFQQGEQR